MVLVASPAEIYTGFEKLCHKVRPLWNFILKNALIVPLQDSAGLSKRGQCFYFLNQTISHSDYKKRVIFHIKTENPGYISTVFFTTEIKKT